MAREFSLKELWDLRAELDSSIMLEKYENIRAVKEKYEKLVMNEKKFSHVFICRNYAFATEFLRRSHNRINVYSIKENIENYEKKYLEGWQNVSVKLKRYHETGFLAGDIWTLRAMFDKFLLYENKGNELQTEQNMILGKAILDELELIMRNDSAMCLGEQIPPIINEVRVAYKKRYGDKQPKLAYYQLREDFMEKN